MTKQQQQQKNQTKKKKKKKRQGTEIKRIAFHQSTDAQPLPDPQRTDSHPPLPLFIAEHVPCHMVCNTS